MATTVAVYRVNTDFGCSSKTLPLDQFPVHGILSTLVKQKSWFFVFCFFVAYDYIYVRLDSFKKCNSNLVSNGGDPPPQPPPPPPPPLSLQIWPNHKPKLNPHPNPSFQESMRRSLWNCEIHFATETVKMSGLWSPPLPFGQEVQGKHCSRSILPGSVR